MPLLRLASIQKKKPESSFSFRFYPNLYCTHTTSPLAQQRLRFTLLALDSARSLPDKKGRVRSRSFQTQIFKKPSALSAVFCAPRYYFIHAEPLKITKSVSSSTPCREQDDLLQGRQEDGSRGASRHIASLYFNPNEYCVVRVPKYNGNHYRSQLPGPTF